MNWLKETIESGLSPEAKADSINQEYKEIHLERLETILDDGYEGGFHNPHLVLNALKTEIERLKSELDAGV